ncbi:hypothetical protein H6504_05335 [Candidatus Woesearchaeota archaeon]|nr:hypothetical protein [Candidatus Woesearchaeota archaeon]
MSKDQEILNTLFREFEDLYGATHTTILSLKSLYKAITQLKNSNTIDQIRIFVESIERTEPKNVPLIRLLQEILAYAESQPSENMLQKKLLRVVKQKIRLFRSMLADTSRNGMSAIEKGDHIVIHSVSYSIIGILIKAKQEGMQFSVLVLKQDPIKTGELITVLEKQKIPFVVAAEYDLPQHVARVTKMFFGALSVTGDGSVITGAGTSSVASVCHEHNIPIYLFANSYKFTKGKTRAQNIHAKSKNQGSIDFKVHSHSCVPMDLVTFLYTEEGRTEKPISHQD